MNAAIRAIVRTAVKAGFEAFGVRDGFALRTTTLWHVQRGGTPTVFDRLLGTRLGAAAIVQCKGGSSGVLVGQHRGEIVTTSLHEVVTTPRTIDPTLPQLARVLAR